MSKIGVTQQHILTNWLFENIRERRVCVFFFMLKFCSSVLSSKCFQGIFNKATNSSTSVHYYVLLRCCHNTSNRSLVTYKSAK